MQHRVNAWENSFLDPVVMSQGLKLLMSIKEHVEVAYQVCQESGSSQHHAVALN